MILSKEIIISHSAIQFEFNSNAVAAEILIRPERFRRLMHDATIVHVRLIKNPDFNLAREITLDEVGAKLYSQRKMFAFETAGKVLVACPSSFN